LGDIRQSKFAFSRQVAEFRMIEIDALYENVC
jgi:hypothetical protein